MASDDLTDTQPDFRCPVCRATQPLQPVCRRCQADLSLVVAARQRIAFLQRQLSRETGLNDRQRSRLANELNLLSPPAIR